MKKQYKIVFLILVIVVVFVSGYYLKVFFDKQKRIKEVNNYKKGFYEGLICQYSCPLYVQNVSNKTRLLPDIECVKKCSFEFKEKYSNFSLNKKELENDNLLKDINNVIENCKKNTIDLNHYSFNNSEYFYCVSKNLVELKNKYDYL